MKNDSPREKREALRREEIRRSILHAGEAVIFRKGYSAMTMDDVAGEACLSKTTLYKYVRSKGRFLFELVRLSMDEEEATYRLVVDSGVSAPEKLRLVIRDIVHSFRKRSDLAHIIMADKAASRILGLIYKAGVTDEDSHIQKGINILNRKSLDITKLLSRIIEEGIASREFRPVDPMETIVFIVSFIDGINHAPSWKRKIIDFSEDELSKRIFVFIYSSINKREGGSLKDQL